ncbi:MAG: diaminopimelate decarboxylase [Firmicutes bacterium]|nr:diaminopimelate decarboxylase [Bacillota bacterium]
MHLGEVTQVNSRGCLEIGGCEAPELAGRYGTPLYVYDEGEIRGRCRSWQGAMQRFWPGGEVVYAGKAFLTMAMAALVRQEGLGLDVCSGGELWTALAAGFPASRVYFQGNGKSPEELQLAVESGVGRVVVDNHEELARLGLLCTRLQRRARVLLRFAPGVEAGAHDHLSTGTVYSKFGFLPGPDLERAVHTTRESSGLELVGLACHVGSQIPDPAPFCEAARAAAQVAAEVAGAFPWADGWELDLGGGLGARYTEDDNPVAPSRLLEEVAAHLREACRHRGLPLPRLVVEPGRSIVAEAAVALYTVLAVKHVPGRSYVVVDGGLHDNPRPALYGARYRACLAERPHARPEGAFWVVGKNCESGDVLARDVPLPLPRAGEVLAVFTAGAYQFAMASNYNRLPRPAVVFAHGGRAELVVARETYGDLVARDRLPGRMEVAAAST